MARHMVVAITTTIIPCMVVSERKEMIKRVASGHFRCDMAHTHTRHHHQTTHSTAVSPLLATTRCVFSCVEAPPLRESGGAARWRRVSVAVSGRERVRVCVSLLA
eukprot:EC799215.1.p1 GENE.EC799215.1~~EC799215.1.p1  ORF type:complete len:105 (-),score=24.57 EC799215.1:116-430(-)